MKRYLFLKLGITILVCAAASPRSQDNFPAHGDHKRQIRQNGAQVHSSQRGDTKPNVQDYQGVMGKPGVDFPVLTYIPRTKFNCRGKKSGYYADLETNCQVFHICDEGRKVSFLCPNGTIFQQSDLICDWWFKVDCAISPTLYDESAEQLHEENRKRKENRKIQQQERRTHKFNSNSNETPRHGREFINNQRKTQTRNNNPVNFAKKDTNQFTGNQQNTRYYENTSQQSIDEYSSSFRETQIPSETASFVSNRYNSEQQKNYYKSINDVREDTQTYLPPKVYITNDFVPIKTATEKIASRGSRTFSNSFTTNKYQYRNQVPDVVKTTTQHTIYSPTVPPFTTTRYTTKIPTTISTTTTESYKTKPVLTTRNKPLSGFYITKEFNPLTTNAPFISNQPSTTQTVFEFSTPVYNAEKIFTSTKSVEPEEYLDLHTTAATVNRPLIGSELIAGSNVENDTVNVRFGSTIQEESTTKLDFIETTTQLDNIDGNLEIEALRKSKQIDLFSTSLPFEYTTIQNTIVPSVPTPFKTRSETSKDSLSTSKFNQFTYLPKSTKNQLVTPKPTIPTEYTTYVTDPTVTDNLSNMLKTLEEIDGENPLLEAELSASRPGLHIPPSAGPKTLHSLAIYFATALDNLVSTNETINDDEPTSTISTTEDDGQVTLLSRSTQDKYNSLFDEEDNQTSIVNTTDDDTLLHHHSVSDDLDLKSFVEHDAQYNDLDGQQSRGPISSTPRIRQLAQVFTQALSAYLDDPDTFKKVLEEIRPTEPPFIEEDITETTTLPTTITTEYRSYTKEEDEVLDFSDADKSSTYRPFIDNNIRTSTQPTIYSQSTTETYLNEISTNLPLVKEDKLNSTLSLSKRIPTPNPLALDLNNGLKLATSSTLQDIDESSVEDNTESDDDYFPFNTGEDEEDARRKATAKPYGSEVKPENSTPISIPAIDSLLPPFKISLNNKIEETNNSFLANEEYLQSAHSQSFVSHQNNLLSNRDGKSLQFNSTDNSIFTTTTDYPTRDTTIYTTENPNNEYYTSTIQSTTNYDSETTRFFTSRQVFDDATTTDSYLTSTTTEQTTTDTPLPTEQTTISKAVPNDHWSTSPEVTKLWESTLYVDPLIINRNLGNSDDSTLPTTYRPEFTTQSLQYRTTTNEYEDEIDLKFSTTEESSDATSTTTEINDLFTAVIDLGIHSLLNSTELEIASSQAQQIFGNLNSTEQDLLIEKMKEAESNSTVRRLILLLVSTCDASLSNNKTVQETRNSILHALLNIPANSNSNTVPELSNRSAKQISLSNDDLQLETTTSYIPETTSFTTSSPYSDELSEKSSAIRTKIEVPSKIVNGNDVHEDTRALELLRSLYSLAAKWGKK